MKETPRHVFNIETLHRDLRAIRHELEFIKAALLDEGELSEWAEAELKRARAEPMSRYTDLDDL